MEISSTTTEYDRLIARHHAMRLRRQLLVPASSSRSAADRPSVTAAPRGATATTATTARPTRG